jgi:hypothetical protein
VPDPDPAAAPRLSGEAVLTFAFDVANEVATDRVQTLLGAAPHRPAFRTDRTAPKSLPVYRPLEVEPGPLSAGGRPVRVVVRVYDVGVVTVTLRTPVAVTDLSELRSFHALVLDTGRPAEAVAVAVCADVCRDLRPVMDRPGPPSDPEGYTTFCLTDLGGEPDANRWLGRHARAAAGLLTDTDPDRLSDAQAEEVLRLRRSFEHADLVVVDWDAALVVDLGGDAGDVLFVLELATVQLEELRWMDRYLDGHMDRLYDLLGRRRAVGTGSAVRTLRRLRVDLTRLVDEVTHITKFVGDWHLARVYLLARERFRLDEWRASVDRRLDQLDQLYALTRGEQYDRRMLWLEVVIVVLILAEILLGLFKG